jgi:hypothetical protein
VLTRLFRRLFLGYLRKAFDAGDLQFFSSLESLRTRDAFLRHIAPIQKKDWVAINAGIWAYHSGAGLLGTPLVAVAAGGMTLAIAQIAFAMTQLLFIRAVIAAVFALPATFAGYHVVLAMAQIGVPSLAWREVFACLGAVFVGGTAWTRLTIFTEPRTVEPGRAIGDGPQPVLAATTREG